MVSHPRGRRHMLLVLLLASAPMSVPAEQRYPPFIPTQGAESDTVPTTPGDIEAIVQRAKSQYTGRGEEDVLRDVYRTDMHYAYLAFVQLFPNSARAAEVRARMGSFRQFKATRAGSSDLVISHRELKDRFNWNGKTSLYQYANFMAGQVRIPETGRLVYFGPLVLGNLQLRGTWRFLGDGLHVETGVTIVFPAARPDTAPLR